MCRIKNCFLLIIVFSGSFFWQTERINGQNVRISTNLGNIDVQLTPNAAPLTVANFLNYVNIGQ